MTHDEAQREQAVERYLLGELAGEAREQFEEHFFECEMCAADLKAGEAFVDGLAGTPRAAAKPQTLAAMPAAKPRLLPRLQPWLTPALAASLLVLAYQNLYVLPGLRHHSDAEAPRIVSNLVLANIDARGAETPTVTAPALGAFLLSIDVPSSASYASYLCSLYDATGRLLWQISVTSRQAENSVALSVPTDKAVDGANELRLAGVPAAGGAPVEIGRYRFRLQVSP